MTNASGPLTGVQVVDLTTAVSGPVAAVILAETTQFVRVATVDHPLGVGSRVPSSSSGLSVGCSWHNHSNRSTRNVRALAG